ncbi:MAG TPA: type III-B CRISPR module RAMP protein Cmr6, partial [Planctomycetaceae bacterium]|nr:type III-B CRISPR module RAMP protein Cmr6 [Planctomycetaceae bacterium]
MALSRRGGSGSRNRAGGRGSNRGSRGRGGGFSSNDPPPNRVPLPESFQSWARHNRHPGLALDKFAKSVSSTGEALSKISENIQRPTIEEVVRLTRSFSPKLYQRLLDRQMRLWETVQAVTFVGRTDGPVTLHLARASSLENAGIALHRIYGLPSLPATGLKGLARAYAETVWFPAQFRADQDRVPVNEQAHKDAEHAWRRIETVFGWSPGSDRHKSYKPRSLAEPATDASAGAVVFHDAWCTDVPKLEADILNNHHRSYYDGESQPTGPPGDWDDPVPVYFLTLAPRQTFRFALSLRRPDIDSASLTEALTLAHQWLIGGLAMLGAGAKTNAGYGAFTFSSDSVPEDVLQQALAPWKTAEQLGRRKIRRIEVELVTPAFLAGAEQFGQNARFGCDMRPATVRGLLRWWWRTLHAGFLTVKQLRELESTIFGDTKEAGALQVRVTTAHAPTGQAQLFDFKDWSPGKDGRPPRRATKPRPDFRKQFQLLPTPNPQTTQGLFYAAYGMDDAPGNDAMKRRYFRHPGQRWTIELIARPVCLRGRDDKSLSAD